jgi:hypothetical protein
MDDDEGAPPPLPSGPGVVSREFTNGVPSGRSTAAEREFFGHAPIKRFPLARVTGDDPNADPVVYDTNGVPDAVVGMPYYGAGIEVDPATAPPIIPLSPMAETRMFDKVMRSLLEAGQKAADPPVMAEPARNDRALELLIAKFPDFNPKWKPEVQLKWFEDYDRLLKAGLRL